MTAAVTIRIQEADFDIAQEISALTKGRTDIGAVVSFSGICRGSEGSEAIAALTLEHYPEMAEAEIARHAETAMSRWPLTGLSVIHRVGRIAPGDNIVLVLTASAHRQAAYSPTRSFSAPCRLRPAWALSWCSIWQRSTRACWRPFCPAPRPCASSKSMTNHGSNATPFM